jgi:hypothetical protein
MRRAGRVVDSPMATTLTRWRHIARFLSVDAATGLVDDDYVGWQVANKRASRPSTEVAAACDEWADFFEWLLAQRAAELAGDRVKRHLVTEWTDSMAYSCRRSAARARGDDPGEWVPQRERRPDLAAEGRAIADDIAARLDEQDDAAPPSPLAHIDESGGTAPSAGLTHHGGC